MPDHPRFRVFCRCGRRWCPYRFHRKVQIMKFPPVPFWLLSGLMWLIIIASWFLPLWFGWIMWPLFAGYVVLLVWLYWNGDRRPSWRVTDSRTTDGDRRTPGWSKEAHRRADEDEEFWT